MSADESRIAMGQAVDKPVDARCIGKISGVFGIKGWVKVFSFTAPRENILDFNPWLISRHDDWHQIEIGHDGQHG